MSLSHKPNQPNNKCRCSDHMWHYNNKLQSSNAGSGSIQIQEDRLMPDLDSGGQECVTCKVRPPTEIRNFSDAVVQGGDSV
ncbi:hypothetical protein COLO4_36835 [Corchorus olitorius]|uniref:Uncharacterized protein n=1 Tax=Corchorus olitorius TaxID=93759 RepID=A0A1R3G4W3_9ROSI|nr:hypothetical protein COLO4_36835 [Corchorus olitorius]